MAACGSPFDANYQNDLNCEDCVRVVRSSKTVQVPCTRNTYRNYTVKVPRQVTEQVPRTVHYTEMINRQKTIPYTCNRSERRTRMQTQKYQVPVTTRHTKMVPVTKKVPRTVYVNVTRHVPQQYTTTTMQTRERQVPVPYCVNVPETRYRTVTEQVPVQKTRVEMDTVNKTVYDSQVRTQCVPETRIVKKTIPVYNVVARPAPPCPPGVADCVGANITANYNEFAFDAADKNRNGQLSFQEYADARARGNLGSTAAVGPPKHQVVSSAPPAAFHTGYQAPTSNVRFSTQSNSGPAAQRSHGSVAQ